uniref:CSON010941 protein n=1 Tax=Culicoides sonorensis TaxID=179676 RepID=A0A336KJP9_CULSO
MEDKGPRFLPDDMSSLTPSEVTVDDVEVEEITEEDVIERPKYSEDELTTLVNYIKNMVTLFNLHPDDFTTNVINQIKNWLIEVTELMLLVFYDGTTLHAAHAFPLSPVSDICYFMRVPNFIFTVDNFHDEIMFGTVTGDVEGSILHVMEAVYAPAFSETTEWIENIKGNLQSNVHMFMSYLTDLHYKMSGLTRLYVPYETSTKSVEDCAKDKWLVKRLESIVLFWTQKIRLCLADNDQLVPHEITCPADEYNFWVYNYEVLTALILQFNTENYKHIIKVLEKVQSLTIKQLKELMIETIEKAEQTRDNYLHLQLLLEPCKTLESLNASSPLTEFADCITEIMHLIHVIWTNSKYYKKPENIETLLKYFSNEIILVCSNKVDLAKILTSSPRLGIKVCDIFITWCLSYKKILQKLFLYYESTTEEGWITVDEIFVFNQIDAFIQRLQDIIEICDAMIAFGRQDEDTIMPHKPKFTCNNSIELEGMFDQIETLFQTGMKTIFASIDMILNLHEKAWHTVKTNFKQLIKNIEEIVENSITSIFVNIENNVEEMLEALTAIIKYSANQRIRETYVKKIGEVKIMETSKYQAGGKKDRFANIGHYSENIIALKIRYSRLERFVKMLNDAHYLPVHLTSDMVTSTFENNFNMTQKSIKSLAEDWINAWNNQTRFTNTLMAFSISYPGLLECNMDEQTRILIDDSKMIEMLEMVPNTYTVKYKPMKCSYKNVVKIVLDYNLISSSLSIKEMMLFRNAITACERKVSPGIHKFNWTEEVNEVFVMECFKSIKELNMFLDFYKSVCQDVVLLCERICSTNILALHTTSVLTLDEVKYRLEQSAESARLEIIEIFQTITNYTLILFERFSQRTTKVTQPWIEFVQRIDSLFQESILVCVQSSLDKFLHLLTGSGSFRADPIINFGVTIDGAEIRVDPPLSYIEQFLQSLLLHLSDMFLVNFSLWKKFEIEKPAFALSGSKSHVINRRILESIERTRNELEKYLLLWKPKKVYDDVMTEVGSTTTVKDSSETA